MSEPTTLSNVTFEVLRFNPETDAKPRIQTYSVPVSKGMTVLDGLTWIKENLDPSLTWRSSCRMGVCGSCGMFINGLPRLACANQIAHLHSDKIVVKPLPNFDIIKDLVPDLESFFDRHRKVKPWLIRHDVQEQDLPTAEYFQSQEELVRYIQFAYCIKCGCCMSACPTVATDDQYIGPQALAQAWRYLSDARDEGLRDREGELFSNHGVFRCHFAGACSEVCPKGVDPAFAIQLLKGDMFKAKLGGCKEKHGAATLQPITEVKKNPKIPDAPAPTVSK